MAESPHRRAFLPKAEPRTPKDAACPPFHPVQQALKAQVGTPWSLRLCIFSFGLLQDGNVGVGVFPEIEEVLIGGASFGEGVRLWHGLAAPIRRDVAHGAPVVSNGRGGGATYAGFEGIGAAQAEPSKIPRGGVYPKLFRWAHSLP